MSPDCCVTYVSGLNRQSPKPKAQSPKPKAQSLDFPRDLTEDLIHSQSMGAKRPARNELLPGTLDMLILKTLSIGVMHGYGIAQHIQQISQEILQVEEGSLYPALQRMLIKGWVVGEWRQSENNRRARFYSLTPKGRKQLAAEIAEFEKVMAAITRVIQTA